MTTTVDPLSRLIHAPEAHPTLRNWSSTYNCSPELLFFPTTNDEVALILQEAVRRGKKVRAVGLHQSPGPIWHSENVSPPHHERLISPNIGRVILADPIVVTDQSTAMQWLVSTRHFTQSSFSPATRTAILGAGLVLRNVNPILASHDLALPTMGSLADVTIGALFAGPDHGSSAFHPVCAANARSATIVLPSGEVRRIEKGKDDLFDAAAAGVGAVGIVTEVEWACDEAFGLEVTMEPCRMEDYLDEDDSGEKLWQLARSSEYVKVRNSLSPFLASPVKERLIRNSPCTPLGTQLWYYPSPTWSTTSPNTVLWRARRVPLPAPARETALTALLAKLTHTLHGLAYFVTTYLFPALQPWLNALLFWLLARSLPKTQTQRGYEAQYMDCGYNRKC